MNTLTEKVSAVTGNSDVIVVAYHINDDIIEVSDIDVENQIVIGTSMQLGIDMKAPMHLISGWMITRINS